MEYFFKPLLLKTINQTKSNQTKKTDDFDDCTSSPTIRLDKLNARPSRCWSKMVFLLGFILITWTNSASAWFPPYLTWSLSGASPKFDTVQKACEWRLTVNNPYGNTLYVSAIGQLDPYPDRKGWGWCEWETKDLETGEIGGSRVSFFSQINCDNAFHNSVDFPWPGMCKCKDAFQEDPTHGFCVPKPTPQKCDAPPGLFVGNPILPATKEKYREEIDYAENGPDSIEFSRTYKSNWSFDSTRASGPLGKAWQHNHITSLKITASSESSSAAITTSDGSYRSFKKNLTSSAWTNDDGTDPDTLDQTGGDWTWHHKTNDSTFIFGQDGKLKSIAKRNGWTTSYAYNVSGQLSTITNQFGRALGLTYNQAGQLTTLTTPDSQNIAYGYDSQGRLSVVTYPDGKSRTFLYEISSYPRHLTGILDESGVLFASFVYNSAGQAIGTELAGSAEHYVANYLPDGSAQITDPLGTARTFTYSDINGKLTVASASVATGSDRSSIASRSQDANGLLVSQTDFTGVIATTTWDVARRLPKSNTHASGTPDERTVTTQWHSTFALPTLITEPGRTTAYTYDNRGNKLSKTVTDTAANTAQLWQWTYNPQQLVETATEPNNAVTTYTYDTRGNVLTSTNPLGHATTYTYDTANRVASTTEPNGLVTTYTYDLRDRLLTQTVGARTTTLTYKPYGTVETVTLPTGLVLAYTYDAGHRLTGWSNNRGESGFYTLDGMGNRTTEQVKDSAGNVAWTTARAINNINRLRFRTEGPNQTSTFGYDANGELTRSTNGLNESTNYGRDSLRRIKTVTDAANAIATLKYNALDAVTEAKDFKGVPTTYARDPQGNATAESSADIGAASTQYDKLGLPSQITDALGQATTITRDLLGRPTGLVFADGKTTTLRYDLTANSKGYLSEIVDRSGTTEYTRDAFGRVILKKQTLANGSVQRVSYAYNANGTLASIGYPNGGGLLAYIYDGTGRLTGLSLNGTPLVTNVAWNPLGQPTAWTWAFTNPSLAASRAYDTAGHLTTTEFSTYVYDTAGRITSLTQNLYQPGDADPTHSTISNSDFTWPEILYDPTGRLTDFSGYDNGSRFIYDANGNQKKSDRYLNGKTTTRFYTLDAARNLPIGFAQSSGNVNTSVTYGYNANGDLLTDGLRSYTYDAEGRLAASTTGATDTSPTTRYAHNALGQRVFKTEPLYPPSQGDEADPGFMQSLIAFFTKLWSPATTQAEQLGYAYVYDEQGTLIAEVGSGGTNSAGQVQYIYLPTANGQMPVAAVIDGATYAVHSDHLNTPRRLTNANGQAVWQWGYSAFGEDKPTVAKNRFANLEVTPNPGTTGVSQVKFNLRYPGQYADEESGLFYNGFRTYSPTTGRYTQGDPIGLDGGWNRFGYGYSNALSFIDPTGLQVPMPPPPVPLPGMPNTGFDAQKLADRLSKAIKGDPEGRERTYQTYTRYNPKTRQCYSGRTSGFDTPEWNIKRRGYNEPELNKAGFEPPKLDKSSPNRASIRGREQQLIDANGGAQRNGGNSANEINSIGQFNPLQWYYEFSAADEFGMPVPTGYCECK